MIRMMYLEEFKQHVVEMRRNIYDVDGLARAFSCETIHSIQYYIENSTNSHLTRSYLILYCVVLH